MEEKKSMFALVMDASSIANKLIESGGEITEELEIQFDDNEKALALKTDGYKFIMDRLKNESEYWKVKAKEFTAVSRSMSNYADRMKTGIKDAMKVLEVYELCGNSYKFKLSPSKSTLEIDLDKLPMEYIIEETIVKADQDKIKEDLKNGVQIQGVRVLENFALRSYVKKGK